MDQTKIINGRTFSRTIYEWDDNKNPHWHCYEDALTPTVICSCGNSTFILTIPLGEYQCRAKCLECGNEDVVYDG